VEWTTRSTRGGWGIAGLLLLATMINYMDRQTLANLIPRITAEWGLTNEQYGDMEFIFGIAFAVGSLTFGVLADRVSVRWLYPAVLLAWSAVGFATGLTRGHGSMLVCRGLLGFFEAGHWPCALIVTQAVLSRSDRVMGNSILQSGASLGAILTPLAIRLLVGDSLAPDAWRLPFFVIGAAGLVWAVAWLRLVPPGLLPAGGGAAGAADRRGGWIAAILADRRFWALVAMVIAINTSWQLIRAWLPTFLQKGRGYSEAEALYFNSVYFLFTDVGCIAAGAAALWLSRRGLGIHASRVLVYLACAVLAALTTVAASLPAGWALLATLLAVAAGTLGVFPCYYAFTQELTVSHMGRVTGMLSFIGWLASAPVQKLFGAVVDRTGSYDLNLAMLGWAPLAGLVVFLLVWPRTEHAADAAPIADG
jgi:ACS family hexuronate transporter-like MFS transporter